MAYGVRIMSSCNEKHFVMFSVKLVSYYEVLIEILSELLLRLL